VTSLGGVDMVNMDFFLIYYIFKFYISRDKQTTW
jgi:hypothetical protein